jgi:hypothetical protein
MLDSLMEWSLLKAFGEGLEYQKIIWNLCKQYNKELSLRKDDKRIV